MNSLNIDLEEGQKVVMAGDSGIPEAARTVIIKSGFGMSTFTSGRALFVLLPDGNTARMDSMEIEKLVEED